jgi:peptide/nickel transport system permease protein
VLIKIGRRVLLAVPTLFAVSLLTFLLQAAMPGDPARAIVGPTATQAAYERVRSELHLNLPLWQQYVDYLGNALHGNLGTSIFTGQLVRSMVAASLPVTLTIVIGATIVSALAGILLGAVSVRIGGPLAKAVDVLSLFGLALPNFWVALMLIAVFAIALPLFPATGWTPFQESPSLWLSSIALPVIALAIGSIAQVAKMTRDGIADAMRQDYIRTLRACGVADRSLLYKHALKNSGVSIVTVIGIGFIGSLAGSLFVENVFVLPGLGSLLGTATAQRDIPVIEGVALAYAVVVVTVNLLIDISYVLLNPKVKAA